MPFQLAKGRGRRWLVVLSVVALLGGYYAMCVTATRQASCTFDEPMHLTAGFSHWTTGEFWMVPDHGPLAQSLAAAALLRWRLNFPSMGSSARNESFAYPLAEQFFFHGGNDTDAMLLRGRAAIALLGVATGLLVFVWSKQLFGVPGALLSLTLFVFCPSMLAHGGVITTDMAATLFFSASLYALWGLLRRVSFTMILLTGLCLAGLFLSKMSAGLVVVMGALLVLWRLCHPAALPVSLPGFQRDVRGRMRRAAILAGVIMVLAMLVWGAIWAAYGFRYSAFGPNPNSGDTFNWDGVLDRPGRASYLILWARAHRLLPESFLFGHAAMLNTAQSHRAFLNGARSDTGWWWFFPYCLAVKTPLALFGTLVLAGAAVVWRWLIPAEPAHRWWRAAAAGAYAAAPLWVLLAVYWVTCLCSHLNIGQRHILPTYPAMYVLAGAAGYWLRPWRWPMAALVGAMLVWAIGASLFIRPHYLAYFNELVGGPRQGYRHLVDSSLDWGQDLPGLKRYLVDHDLDNPAESRVYLSYFGTGNPEHYHIHARELPGAAPTSYPDDARRLVPPLAGGWYCISATTLQSTCGLYAGAWNADYEARYQQYKQRWIDLRRQMQDPAQTRDMQENHHGVLREVNFYYRDLRFGRLCAFLRQRRPDDEVGYSILIYHLSDEDIDAALNGPPAELHPGPT